MEFHWIKLKSYDRRTIGIGSVAANLLVTISAITRLKRSFEWLLAIDRTAFFSWEAA